MKTTFIVIAVAVLGCSKGETKQAPACPQQSAELKTWLQGLYAGEPTAPPWPTGDAAFDAELDAWRQRVRDTNKPIDLTGPRPLLEEGRKPGLLERELAGCDPAKAQITKVNEAAPADQPAAWIGLADAIAACNCKPNIAHVKSVLYVMQRGPD